MSGGNRSSNRGGLKPLDVPEHLTEQGARALAARLQAYWRGQVRVWAEPVSSARDGAAWAVRSDMVHGAPRVNKG